MNELPGPLADDRPGGRFLRAALWLVIVGAAVKAVCVPSFTQWDFKLYKGCARAMALGADPYDEREASKKLGYALEMPCIYPPLALEAYRPFAALSPGPSDYGAQFLWSALKLAAIALLIALWRRFTPIDGGAATLAFFLLAYSDPFLIDLRSGNIAVFEQLPLWIGLAALVEGRDLLFGLCVAAAAQVKLQPAVFLLLLLLRPRPAWGAFLASSAAAAGLFGLNFLRPELARSYLAALARGENSWLNESARINSSAFSFFRAVAGLAAGGEPGRWAWLLIGPAIAAVLAETARVCIRPGGGLDQRSRRVETALLFCAATPLLLPRFKDYSYLLLLAPTLYVLRLPLPAGRRAGILACAVLNSTEGLARKLGAGDAAPLFSYFKLAAAGQLWWALRGRLSAPAISGATSSRP
ncbi:MAG TPA: glycosyltransferase 87 family protein [Elusimicrobiota bacterium]|nr:glycosyltransferase 87 family protein [Elusimicrobiota bacterium]